MKCDSEITQINEYRCLRRLYLTFTRLSLREEHIGQHSYQVGCVYVHSYLGFEFQAYILGVWYSVFLQDLDSHWEGGVCVCFGIVGEALL